MMNDSSETSAPKSFGRSYDFDEALDRIQHITGCFTQQELADLIGIRQSSISDASKRKSIPSKWLIFFVRKYGLNPDWILYGSAPVYLHEFSTKEHQFEIRTVTDIELLAELSRRLDQIHKLQLKKIEKA